MNPHRTAGELVELPDRPTLGVVVRTLNGKDAASRLVWLSPQHPRFKGKSTGPAERFVWEHLEVNGLGEESWVIRGGASHEDVASALEKLVQGS